MIELKVCPSCLKEGFSTFSPYAKKHFLGGKSVSHILPYDSLTSTDSHLENKGRLSLSGAQEKYSLVIDGGNFRLAEENERSTYIAKPKLTGFDNREYSPANENLTMQIASQVYGIKTAENAVCFTQNGEQVYVTKRFDIKADGSKIHQEDFASLAGISKDTNGANFKYGALDYADIAELIKNTFRLGGLSLSPISTSFFSASYLPTEMPTSRTSLSFRRLREITGLHPHTI